MWLRWVAATVLVVKRGHVKTTEPESTTEPKLEPSPRDLTAYQWAETLSTGEQDVLLTSSLRRLQDMIDSRVSPSAAPVVDQRLIEAFKVTAIKVHMLFKHDVPWEDCEWIECEDRRKMIEPLRAAALADPEGEAARLVEQICDAVAQLDIPHVGRPGNEWTQAIDTAVKTIQRFAPAPTSKEGAG